MLGSAATGQTHPDSDLDLAVVPRSSQARHQKLTLLADSTRVGFDRIDLVFWDTDDLVLRYAAVKHNQLVYQTADFERGTWYSWVVRQYLDFLPYLAVQRAAYKQRLRHG